MSIYLIDKRRLTEDRTANLDLQEVSDDTFIYLAGHTGDCYTIQAFEKMFNEGEIDYTYTFIRFIA